MKIGDYIFLVSCLILSYMFYLCNPYTLIGGVLFTVYSYIILKSEDETKRYRRRV